MEASRFLDIFRQSPRIEDYFATPQIEKEAINLLHKYHDHPFSFVDGISFCIMKKEGLRDAFAFDSHFAIAGFNRVSIDVPV
jgi:hypothetical protein